MSEWRAIAGYEGLYEVSDDGHVRSLTRYVKKRTGVIAPVAGRVLKAAPSRRGYLAVSLWRENAGKTREVHRLVAIAFVPNPLGLPEVDHIDSVRKNNSAANLTWCTRSENLQRAHARGVTRAVINPKRAPKLTIDAVLAIRSRREQGESYGKIGRDFDISRAYAREICLGVVWRM